MGGKKKETSEDMGCGGPVRGYVLSFISALAKAARAPRSAKTKTARMLAME